MKCLSSTCVHIIACIVNIPIQELCKNWNKSKGKKEKKEAGESGKQHSYQPVSTVSNTYCC